MRFVLVAAASVLACSVSAAELPDARQATLEFIGIDGKKVQEVVEFENVDGLAMFEGDIILGRTDDILYGGHTHKLSGRDIVTQGLYNTSSGAKWPNGRVPFVIASSFTSSQRDAITTYMREIEAVAKVQFVARSNESAYINIVPTTNTNICGSSYVGRQGGKQDVTLRCFGRRTITHELMHALGFWHEQSRPDRDNYITIDWSNVNPAYAYNLEKRTSQVAVHGGYDYSSIMHYHPYAFAIDPSKPTITVRTSTPGPIDPPIEPCIPGQICMIPQSISSTDVTFASVPEIGGSIMTTGDKAALAHVYGAPLVQPYVTYGYAEWLRCTNYQFTGAVQWDAVESGLTYQFEQLFGSQWSQIYSGPNTYKSGVYGTPRSTVQFRVRAIKNGAPGSWHTFSSYVPSCSDIIR